MPRISNNLLQCVVYLYDSEASARAGANSGGTGFLVAKEHEGKVHVFVVTNHHVAVNGFTTVRIQSTDSETAVIVVPPGTWSETGGNDDIAVAEIPPRTWPANASPHLGISWESFLPTAEELEELEVGIGDEVFMVGRSTAHVRADRMTPVARFGNISTNREDGPVLDGRECWVDAHLVEMRSLSGASGSPVFLNVEMGNVVIPSRVRPLAARYAKLLGIDTGHKYNAAKVLKKKIKEAADVDFIVEQNTGFAIVAPADRIDLAISRALGIY